MYNGDSFMNFLDLYKDENSYISFVNGCYETGINDFIKGVKVVEFDLDGVLYDMIKASREQSGILRLYNFNEDDVTKYDFSSCVPDVRKAVFSTFERTETFLMDDMFYKGALDCLYALLECGNIYKKPFVLTIHTYCKAQNIAKERLVWLRAKMQELVNKLCGERCSCNALVLIICDFGQGGKRHIISDIIVEDNIDFLDTEEEAYKVRFAPKRPYVLENNRCVVCDDLYDSFFTLYNRITYTLENMSD